jgi:MtfA peptidase
MRRKRLKSKPFPTEWKEYLEQHVSLYRRLPSDDRQELQGHINVFLAEKNFEGCGGLELTDNIRINIAAQACILILHRPTDYFSRLTTTLVYPAAYVVEDKKWLLPGVQVKDTQTRQGESWSHGAIVLSWDDVLRGCAGEDGNNVVLHEFAHQLDTEDGAPDGTPVLDDGPSYSRWANVLGEDYDRLRKAVRSRRNTLLDPYGATDPAEFFAVATEFFFDKSIQLCHEHSELYEELRRYYKQDPAKWHLEQ